MTRGGKFNKRLILQRFDGTQNDRGQVQYDTAGNWDDIATLWAKVEPLSGRELERARTVMADATVRVTVRYHTTAAISTKDRWKFKTGGRLLYIGHHHDPAEAHGEIVTLCGEDPN